MTDTGLEDITIERLAEITYVPEDEYRGDAESERGVKKHRFPPKRGVQQILLRRRRMHPRNEVGSNLTRTKTLRTTVCGSTVRPCRSSHMRRATCTSSKRVVERRLLRRLLTFAAFTKNNHRHTQHTEKMAR